MVKTGASAFQEFGQGYTHSAFGSGLDEGLAKKSRKYSSWLYEPTGEIWLV
jgi:hypothetical protein